MDENELNQTLSNLRWGTGMPIIVMTASGIEQVRFRGNYSLRVKDFQKLQEILPQIEETSAWAGSLVITKVTDSVAEFAPGLTSAHQLTARLDEISKKVNSSIKTNLDKLGLDLISFTIEAMDIL